MGIAIVEIVEFTGNVEEESGETSSTYLVGINGKYKTSYGSPQYEYPPESLIEEYKIRSYSVGNARNWNQFYNYCTELVKSEDIFTNKLPRELVRKSVNRYISSNEKSSSDINDGIDDGDIDEIVDDITSI